jgi:predicted enzyme related to lactoylglutathione lyase
MGSAITWFEIPVSDIERAVAFYSSVLDCEISILDMTEEMGSFLGMIPARGGIGGALVQNSQYAYVPSEEGSLVYLHVDGEVDKALERALAAGVEVLLPKSGLGDQGFTAWIRDSEGNRIGLHGAE